MKKTLQKWVGLAITLAILSCVIPGCAWSIGDGKGHTTSAAQPTRGQELIDLKKARDKGAITEEEYQAQRKSIMER